MRLSTLFTALQRPTHRTRLRDLHSFGIVNVYRRPSIFRLWEPLRGEPAGEHEFEG